MSRIVDASRICLKRESLRRTIPIALVVGMILIGLNHGDTILSGEAGTSTWVRAGSNFIVPFIVSNLGLLAGQPDRAPDAQPRISVSGKKTASG